MPNAFSIRSSISRIMMFESDTDGHRDERITNLITFQLILMGLFTIMLARRKHRYGLLVSSPRKTSRFSQGSVIGADSFAIKPGLQLLQMKVCGSVAVVCALVCVLVTITTTVIHMSRLQNLRECVYTARARYVYILSFIHPRINYRNHKEKLSDSVRVVVKVETYDTQ